MLFCSLVRDQEVDGSNPFAPTNFSQNHLLTRQILLWSSVFLGSGTHFFKSLSCDQSFSAEFLALRCGVASRRVPVCSIHVQDYSSCEKNQTGEANSLETCPPDIPEYETR